MEPTTASSSASSKVIGLVVLVLLIIVGVLVMRQKSAAPTEALPQDTTATMEDTSDPIYNATTQGTTPETPAGTTGTATVQQKANTQPSDTSDKAIEKQTIDIDAQLKAFEADNTAAKTSE